MIEPIRRAHAWGGGTDVDYPILAGHTITIKDSGKSYAGLSCSCGWKPRWSYIHISHGDRTALRHIRRMQRDVVKQAKVRLLNEYKLAKVAS